MQLGVADLLARWVSAVAGRCRTVLAILVALTLVFGWVAVDRFRIDSDLSKLIQQEAPWRDDYDAFRRQFPHLVDTGILVVSGTSYQAVEDSTRRLTAALEQTFTDVFAPGTDDWFRDHALLFLDPDVLDDMVDRFAQAQPVLTAVATDPSLRSVLDLIDRGLGEPRTAGFDLIVSKLEASARAIVEGGSPAVIWTDEFFRVDGTVHRLVIFKGQASFETTLENEQIVRRLREIVRETPIRNGVTVALTGEIALRHEEIEAGLDGVRIAGWVSVVLLFGVLIVGVRSGKIIAATFSMLLVGITWTIAFAMVTIGEFNTLSIIFLVMFFGLGVDFAIHFSLRLQEAVNVGATRLRPALTAAAQSVGAAIALCTATTALGFLGFYPTDYKGLADLGVISAGGMAIALFLTFTWLPAFYAATGRVRRHTMDLPTADRLVVWLTAHRVPVLAVVLLLALGSAWISQGARFDYSVLALRDPASESMRALRLLQREQLVTDYSLFVVADPGAVDRARLTGSPLVDRVIEPGDYVPGDQDDKRFALQDTSEFLRSALYPFDVAAPPSEGALRDQIGALAERFERSGDAALVGLARAMRALSGNQIALWQTAVLRNLNKELDWLRRALAVEPVTLDTLPEPLRRRLLTEDGQHLTVVLPAGEVDRVETLSAFVEGVRAIAPNATGRPAVEWGVGQIVLDSFLLALGIALAAITGVLVIALRSVVNAVLILVPLGLTAVFTFAAGVLFGMPLNMANVLVLPLIFGLGVDNGIHVVERYVGEGDVANLMHSSTPRAVILSTLTTIGTFASLCLSPHQGTASIGWLLTVAVALLLVFTVLLLPVLLSFASPGREHGDDPRLLDDR